MKNKFALLLIALFTFIGVACAQTTSPHKEGVKISIFDANYSTQTVEATMNPVYLNQIRQDNLRAVHQLSLSIPETIEASTATCNKPIQISTGLLASRLSYRGPIDVRIQPNYIPSILAVGSVSAGFNSPLPYSVQTK